MRGVEVTGVYSHLARSDSDDQFTKLQLERFMAASEGGIMPPLQHIGNSGAVLNHPAAHLDMVRVGVLMYGLAPCSTPEGAENLRKMGIFPVLTLKTQVAHVKIIQKGESVGYGRGFTADREMEIATIPLGYGDGISRQLSNRGHAMINGMLCPIVGNVCMDQMMVASKSTKIGDEVTIIGEGIFSEDIAGWQGSINYEVLTALSNRIKREYLALGG